MTTAKFITLEGGEGVGKTTNIAYIETLLQQQGIQYISTREPGGTAFAEKIRGLLLADHEEKICQHSELLMMFAARAQHLHYVIKPALQAGIWVLCDRFTDTTYAYQGYGRKLNRETISQLEQLVQGGFRPDLTLLLDAPVELVISRVKARARADRFEQEQPDFFERVRQGYLQRAKSFPNRISIINADQALTAVQEEIEQALVTLLPC